MGGPLNYACDLASADRGSVFYYSSHANGTASIDLGLDTQFVTKTITVSDLGLRYTTAARSGFMVLNNSGNSVTVKRVSGANAQSLGTIAAHNDAVITLPDMPDNANVNLIGNNNTNLIYGAKSTLSNKTWVVAADGNSASATGQNHVIIWNLLSTSPIVSRIENNPQNDLSITPNTAINRQTNNVSSFSFFDESGNEISRLEGDPVSKNTRVWIVRALQVTVN